MLSLLTRVLVRIVHLLFKFVIGFDIAASKATSRRQTIPVPAARQDREQLLDSLRGKTVHIPDLTNIFGHWPDSVNPDVCRLREEIDEWLKPFDVSPKVLAALQKSDFGYFGATWWPHADFNKLKVVTYLIIWLFIWDDEIDISDGSMYKDFCKAQLYRDQTMAFARYALKLDHEEPEVDNKIIRAFTPIADALNEVYDSEHRDMIFRELEFDINMAGKEQRIRLSHQLPTLEEFWEYRLGASAVYLCLAFQEYSWKVNDLLSLKKEIRKGAVESLVPILCYHGRDAQSAVNEVVSMIKGDVAKLDEAAERLLTKYEDKARVRGEVAHFIDGCKSNAVGNLTWSLVTGRYGMQQAGSVAKELTIVL